MPLTDISEWEFIFVLLYKDERGYLGGFVSRAISLRLQIS